MQTCTATAPMGIRQRLGVMGAQLLIVDLWLGIGLSM
jgi:hypothetical protein